MNTNPLPMVVAHGNPRDVGRAHGQAFADLVHASVASCHRRIDEVLQLPLAAAQRFAERQGDLLGELDARIVDEMHGIAEGADIDPLDVVLLHVRTALSRMVESGQRQLQDGDALPVDSANGTASLECTTIAVGPHRTDGETVLAAQNWDMHPSYRPRVVVVNQQIDGEPGLLFIAEAGMIFSHGMNSEGVAILGNALYAAAAQSPDRGIPVQVTRRIAMREPDAGSAAKVIRGLDRAHAVNHLLADASGTLVDLEALAGAVYDVAADDGVLVHTNHLLSPTARAHSSVAPGADRSDSVRRRDRAVALLADRDEPIDVDTIRSLLGDHDGAPESICRHPEPDAAPHSASTVASTVFDLTNARMVTTSGPPCTGVTAEYGWGT